MTDYSKITIHITLEAANDPVSEPSTPPPPCTDEDPQCDLWSLCNDPLCFRAGCRNVFTNHSNEVKS